MLVQEYILILTFPYRFLAVAFATIAVIITLIFLVEDCIMNVTYFGMMFVTLVNFLQLCNGTVPAFMTIGMTAAIGMGPRTAA